MEPIKIQLFCRDEPIPVDSLPVPQGLLAELPEAEYDFAELAPAFELDGQKVYLFPGNDYDYEMTGRSSVFGMKALYSLTLDGSGSSVRALVKDEEEQYHYATMWNCGNGPRYYLLIFV